MVGMVMMKKIMNLMNLNTKITNDKYFTANVNINDETDEKINNISNYKINFNNYEANF